MQKHKVVVAGCGGMSNVWLDYATAQENVEIAGLVDLFKKNAKVMAEKRELNVPLFTDLSQALKETEADLVFDVTVPASHKQIVTTALNAGCDVFGEKPMAESMKDAQEILAIVKKTGRHYSVMQNRRYLKQIRAFRDFLGTGSIGKVGSIHADFFLGPHFGGFRDEMEHPLIVDMAIHSFDQARFITGTDPVTVYCQEFNPPGSWYDGNASAVCIFEMSDGTVFSYRGSWCAQGLSTSWECDWRVTGSKGSVKWDGTHTPVCEVIEQAKAGEFMNILKTLEVPERWDGREGHFGCLDEMFNALEQGRHAETDCSDNIKSIAMVLGAVESAKTGKKVRL